MYCEAAPCHYLCIKIKSSFFAACTLGMIGKGAASAFSTCSPLDAQYAVAKLESMAGGSNIEMRNTS